MPCVGVSEKSKMAACNRKWVWNIISVCIHDSNKIPTATPMLLRSCIMTALVRITPNTVLCQGKWYIKDDGLQPEVPSGYRPPSWLLAHVRQCLEQSSRVALHRKHRYSRWNFVAISSRSWYIGISGLEAAILNFPLPVWSDSIWTYPLQMLDLENVGLTVGISFLSHLEANI